MTATIVISTVIAANTQTNPKTITNKTIEEVVEELRPLLSWPSNEEGNKNVRTLYRALQAERQRGAEAEAYKWFDSWYAYYVSNTLVGATSFGNWATDRLQALGVEIPPTPPKDVQEIEAAIKIEIENCGGDTALLTRNLTNLITTHTDKRVREEREKAYMKGWTDCATGEMTFETQMTTEEAIKLFQQKGYPSLAKALKTLSDQPKDL